MSKQAKRMREVAQVLLHLGACLHPDELRVESAEVLPKGFKLATGRIRGGVAGQDPIVLVIEHLGTEASIEVMAKAYAMGDKRRGNWGLPPDLCSNFMQSGFRIPEAVMSTMPFVAKALGTVYYENYAADNRDGVVRFRFPHEGMAFAGWIALDKEKARR